MRQTVAIDFDGTLVDDADNWMVDEETGWSAVDFIKQLQKRGFEVLIHSCRARYLQGHTLINAMLRDAGLRDVTIWTEPGKPIAWAYIDNRGVHCAGGKFGAAMRALLELV